MDNYVTGSTIRTARKKKGITQSELARDAEVVLESGDGRVELTRVKELIPKGFRL